MRKSLAEIIRVNQVRGVDLRSFSRVKCQTTSVRMCDKFCECFECFVVREGELSN